jgi:hypothetical protein
MRTRNRKIIFVGSKVRPVRRADNLADCLDNVESLTSRNPIAHQSLLTGIAFYHGKLMPSNARLSIFLKKRDGLLLLRCFFRYYLLEEVKWPDLPATHSSWRWRTWFLLLSIYFVILEGTDLLHYFRVVTALILTVQKRESYLGESFIAVISPKCDDWNTSFEVRNISSLLFTISF